MFKKLWNALKTTKKSTIVRVVIQVLTIVNQIIAIVYGETAPVYLWCSFGATVIISLVNMWYNNDFSSLAKLAGNVLTALKDGNITSDEVENLVEGVTITTITTEEEATEENKESEEETE